MDSDENSVHSETASEESDDDIMDLTEDNAAEINDWGDERDDLMWLDSSVHAGDDEGLSDSDDTVSDSSEYDNYNIHSRENNIGFVEPSEDIETEDDYLDHWNEIERRMDNDGNNTISDNQIIKDWLELTGKTMSSRHVYRLKALFMQVNSFCLYQRDFDRLKNNWSLLTGIDSDIFERLKRDYLLLDWTRLTPSDLGLLRKYWSLFSGTMDTLDFKRLKRDYLVLHWTRMRLSHFIRLKRNWSLCAARMGRDDQQNIIKTWLFDRLPMISLNDDKKYNNNKEKMKYTKWCLERGADVNAVVNTNFLLRYAASFNETRHAELLLSYGADVTLRNRTTGETPLDIARIYHYKEHEDIVNIMQTAEKSFKKSRLRNHTLHFSDQSVNNGVHNDTFLRIDTATNSGSPMGNKRQHESCYREQERWIHLNQSPYLNRAGELFGEDRADIEDLLKSVINHMYILKIYRIELKFEGNKSVDRFDKMRYIHRVFNRMCSKLFNIFDKHFNEPVHVRFPIDARFGEAAELTFLLEIHPDIEWVVLKVFAVPWDPEYFLYGKASWISSFDLRLEYFCGKSAQPKHLNLLFDYRDYLGPYQQQFNDPFS